MYLVPCPSRRAAVATTIAKSWRRRHLAPGVTRYPALASGPIYPRLAMMLDGPVMDPNHRAAWQHGSVHAMDLWWEQVPRPPKTWWLNWRDALG